MNNSSLQAVHFPGSAPPVLHPEYHFIRYFRVLDLAPGAQFDLESRNLEMAILILQGQCRLAIDSRDFSSLVSRAEVFNGLPASAYIPIQSRFALSGGPAQIALFGGHCEVKTEPALIKPQEVEIKKVGQDNWSREVRLLIGSHSPSVNIILGETINPPGNWSGTPPHRHEKHNLPAESRHEELYYFRLDKPQGWGLQRTYDPNRKINELLFLQDHSVTFMPWGYHQVAAAPGYTLYYTFFLAGKGKSLTGCVDPDHAWIQNLDRPVVPQDAR